MPTETRCVRIRLKPGAEDAIRAWKDFLEAHREEAAATLRAEGVAFEAAFLDMTGETPSLIYVMRCADFEKAAEVARNSQSFIDVMHRKLKEEWWEAVEPLDTLIYFEAR